MTERRFEQIHAYSKALKLADMSPPRLELDSEITKFYTNFIKLLAMKQHLEICLAKSNEMIQTSDDPEFIEFMKKSQGYTIEGIAIADAKLEAVQQHFSFKHVDPPTPKNSHR